MAKHAFDTFIPLSVDSDARKDIIFDFFDLLSAIAANGKVTGLGGRKLSRLSGWWAFDFSETVGKGFDGGYRSWENAADATSHLFFAYLRSRMPDDNPGSSGISQLPRSLLALVSQTEYPPETPSLLHTSTPKVVMVVERVSPTPYALLRRARNFAYPEDDDSLQKFSEYDDPVRALTFECRRVLDCISSINQSVTVNNETSITSPTDTSWSRFEDFGFSSVLDEKNNKDNDTRGYHSADTMRSPQSGTKDLGRPMTPSWADFMSSGFADDSNSRGAGSLLLPPEQILPPLNPQRVQSSQSHVRGGLDDSLEPGELSYVSRIELDETFWWVWMTSLASEEPAARKAVFGRCALVETELRGAKWLVMEEQMKGAAAAPDTNATVIQKRSKFGLSVKGRPRRSSLGKKSGVNGRPALASSASTPTLAPSRPALEQRARVQAAAAELIRQQTRASQPQESTKKRNRDGQNESKTNSVMTLGLGNSLQSEAAPAMQWARKFDKETIRSRYLGDNLAGTGVSRAPSPANTMDLISATKPGQDSDSPQRSSDLTALPAVGQAPVMTPPENATPSMQSPITPQTHARGESDKSVVSPADINHTQRKPVSKPAPKLREEAMAYAPTPAAAAAAAAMKNTTSPTDTNGAPATSKADLAAMAKSKTGSTRKFKSLFNRKKPEEEEPEALAKHREMSLRKKQEQGLPPTAATPDGSFTASPRQAVATPVEAPAPMPDFPAAHAAHAAPAAAVPMEAGEFMEAGEPGPAIESESGHPTVAGMDESTHHDTVTEHAPVMAAGAHVPVIAAESHADSTLQEEAALNKARAAAAVPTGEHDMADDEFSATSIPAPGKEEGDRWSQIRKNAADRKSDDVATPASTQRMSQMTEKTDDGETSGEESEFCLLLRRSRPKLTIHGNSDRAARCSHPGPRGRAHRHRDRRTRLAVGVMT